MNIVILGAGAWGTALGINLSAAHAVTLWARDRQQIAAMRSHRSNQRYLPGHALPPALSLEPDLSAALHGRDAVIVAATVAGLRPLLQMIDATGCKTPVIWLCKGFERPDARLPHEVYAETMGSGYCAVLSGPSFAQEVAAGLPTALTLASSDPGFATATAQALHSPTLRVYSHDDIVGVEVGGAVKNVIAIAAGVCDGLGLGLNARAALITRGLAEMTRFGVALGARAETFMGLAGMGDLILTCTGDLSRNRRVGLALAKGTAVAQTQASLGHVAEGVFTATEVQRRARACGVEMPITDAVCRVIEQQESAESVARELLARNAKPEQRR